MSQFQLSGCKVLVPQRVCSRNPDSWPYRQLHGAEWSRLSPVTDSHRVYLRTTFHLASLTVPSSQLGLCCLMQISGTGLGRCLIPGIWWVTWSAVTQLPRNILCTGVIDRGLCRLFFFFFNATRSFSYSEIFFFLNHEPIFFKTFYSKLGYSQLTLLR